MSTANWFELVPPAAVFVVGVASGWAKYRQGHPSRAELRAARAHARDFAASDRAGYVTRADWGPDPVRLELPTPRKEGS